MTKLKHTFKTDILFKMIIPKTPKAVTASGRTPIEHTS